MHDSTPPLEFVRAMCISALANPAISTAGSEIGIGIENQAISITGKQTGDTHSKPAISIAGIGAGRRSSADIDRLILQGSRHRRPNC
jgi:hypothetical protein